jgi:hypothetical protein
MRGRDSPWADISRAANANLRLASDEQLKAGCAAQNGAHKIGPRCTDSRFVKVCDQGRNSVSARTNGACADGQVVWFWHPLLVSSSRRQVGPTWFRQSLNPRMTVTSKNSSPGRARSKPLKPLRGEMPGASGWTCGDDARRAFAFCTRGFGCSEYPAFPAPSDFRGTRFLHSSGVSGRETAGACLVGCLKI